MVPSRLFHRPAMCLAFLGLTFSFAPWLSAEEFPAFEKLPSHAELPNPLLMMNGSPITTAEDWMTKRRPELKALFQHYMYGYLPKPPTRWEVVGSPLRDEKFLDGRATISESTVAFFGPDLQHRLHVLLIVPNKRSGLVPVFVGMNFCGNHAVINHPGIHIPTSWTYKSCAGVVDDHATEKGRGGQADVWNVDMIIDRGYALATFYSGDIDPDTPEFSDGIEPTFFRGTSDDPGAIASWAWGYHRVIDLLTSKHSDTIDTKRIAAVGHSRNGKTTLLAAAMDERIALAIPHQAGCGGTAPSRGKVGESVKQINDRFPHWFCDEFTKFNDDTSRLPFDQHCLVALVAPRPVLFTNAVEDQWANPDGQFEMLKAADPVYRLLKAGGLDAQSPPPSNTLINSQLGYFIRPGKHSMNRDDWKVFLDYADKRLR